MGITHKKPGQATYGNNPTDQRVDSPMQPGWQDATLGSDDKDV